MCQSVREHHPWWVAGLGIIALGLYGFAASSSPTPTSGACWPPTAASSSPAHCCGDMVVDGFRPDRRDVIGALVCLVGVAVTRTLLLVTGAWDAVRMWLRA